MNLFKNYLKNICEFLEISYEQGMSLYQNAEKEYYSEWSKYSSPNEFYSKSPAYLFYQLKMRKATPSFTHRRLIINFLNSRSICTVLDYGSGIGLLTTELNKYRFDVFFTDIEGIQTEFLKYFLNKANLKAYYIPLSKINEFKGFFDAVVCLEVLEHSMDFYETLSNIVNLSRKIIILSYTFGGRFQEPGHINKGVKLGKIVSDYLKNYGFNKVELKIWNNRVKFYEKK